MKLFHYNNIFYTLILTITFFAGMDGSLLYRRTFLDTEHHTLIEHLYFFFSVFGCWFIGYFYMKKIVEKYELNYIFRVSLLIASLSIWIQYKTNHHSLDRTFSYILIDNVFCSIFLGLLTYSLLRIINNKNDLQQIKKQKQYSLLFIILGVAYSQTLVDEKLDSGFLLTSLVYFATYIYFLKNSINKLDYQIRLNLKTPLIMMCLIVLGSIGLIYIRFLESFKFYSEEAYPAFIFVAFIIFERTQHGRNKIKSNHLNSNDKDKEEKTGINEAGEKISTKTVVPTLTKKEAKSALRIGKH